MINKITHIHIHTGILFSHKKEWNLAICDNMDRLQRPYARWNNSERNTNTLWYHLYVWHLKYDTNELIYETDRLTDVGNRLVVVKEEEGQGKDGSLGLADTNYYI